MVCVLIKTINSCYIHTLTYCYCYLYLHTNKMKANYSNNNTLTIQYTHNTHKINVQQHRVPLLLFHVVADTEDDVYSDDGTIQWW